MVSHGRRQEAAGEVGNPFQGPGKTGPARMEPGRMAGPSRQLRIADLTQSRGAAKAQGVFLFFASLRLCAFALDSLYGAAGRKRAYALFHFPNFSFLLFCQNHPKNEA